MAEPTPITSRAELITLAARLDGVKELGYDTEFHAEQSYRPKVMLLQFSTRDELFVVDPLASEIRGAIGGFLELIRMRGQTVVGHALEHDLEIFLRLCGGLPARVFDTQLAAAFVGRGGPIALSALLEAELSVTVEKLYSLADWGRRPLPPAQVAYALDDVRHLLPLADRLRAQLDARGRTAWLEEEHARLLEPDTFLPADPMLAHHRVGRRPPVGTRARAVLEQVAAERERIALSIDRPPRWILSDDALLDLARRAPTRPEDLSGETRRRPAPNLEKYGARWLAAVQVGLEAPLPSPEGQEPASERSAAVGLGRWLAQWCLSEAEVAPWLLPSLDGPMRAALASPPATTEALAQALELRGWRAELLAGPLHRVLFGGGAIAVKDGAVRIEPSPAS